MDYNGRPWTYEVVGLGEHEKRYVTTDYEKSKEVYDGFKEANLIVNGIVTGKRFKTVLLCQSRKGTLKGSIED